MALEGLEGGLEQGFVLRGELALPCKLIDKARVLVAQGLEDALYGRAYALDLGLLEVAVDRGVEDDNLHAQGIGGVLALLEELHKALAMGQPVLGRLVQVGAELGKDRELPELGQVDAEAAGDRSRADNDIRCRNYSFGKLSFQVLMKKLLTYLFLFLFLASCVRKTDWPLQTGSMAPFIVDATIVDTLGSQEVKLTKPVAGLNRPPEPFTGAAVLITQAELANHSGVTATNISLLENDRVDIGKKRAEQIANAFGVHPAIIMFPEYEAKEIQKVA